MRFMEGEVFFLHKIGKRATKKEKEKRERLKLVLLMHVNKGDHVIAVNG
jgi:hypothetical protein